MDNINNDPHEIQGMPALSDSSQDREEGEGVRTFIEHGSVLNQCQEEEGIGEKDVTKICDKNVLGISEFNTSQWESIAWGWLSPSHPSDQRMMV